MIFFVRKDAEDNIDDFMMVAYYKPGFRYRLIDCVDFFESIFRLDPIKILDTDNTYDIIETM